MNFIANSKKTEQLVGGHPERHWIIVRHFFDFRAGKGIANSFEGFLRPLAMQIIADSAQAGFEISSLRKTLGIDKSPTTNHQKLSITVPNLQQAVLQVLQRAVQSVLLMIDGLDEYEGDKNSLVRFIRNLASSNRRVCVASRPENPLPSLFKDVPTIRMQDCNSEAIETYCHHRLSVASTDSNVAEAWAKQIAHRSAGVFLWARFAVDEIIEGMESGLKLDSGRIKTDLDAIPDELGEIYARKLKELDELEQISRWSCAAPTKILPPSPYQVQLPSACDADGPCL